MAVKPGNITKNDWPQLVFNNNFFGQVDWKTEPTEDLKELYRQRALQLREKYDYLILSYSGGSDSHNILQTFINNNIRLDEIITVWPVEALSHIDADAKDFSFNNMWSEWKLAVLPRLEWLSVHRPEIKITIHDFSKNLKDWKYKDGWQLDRSGGWHPAVGNRLQLLQGSKSFDQHHNIGLMTGIEKPKICYRDNKFYLYFADFVVHQNMDVDCYLIDKWQSEYFYWAPEAEKILRKQAHIVKKFFQATPQLLPYLHLPTPANYRNFYEQIVRALVYPDWESRWFQTDKAPSANYAVMDKQISDALQIDFVSSWSGGKKEMLESINSNFYNKEGIINPFVSDFYEI
jgi:hypothetical protein